MTTVQLAAFILGMVLGGAMIAVSCFVYVKTQRFGVGGSILTALGAVLIGLSIFTSVEFSVSPTGDFKFQTQIYNAAKDAAKDAIKEVAVADASLPTQRQRPSAVARQPIPSASSPVQHNPPASTPPSEAPLVASNTLDRLRLQEQVQDLIDNKNYLEAMKLDPSNVLPVMYYIEQSVLRGKYSEAVAYFPTLQKNNGSGI